MAASCRLTSYVFSAALVLIHCRRILIAVAQVFTGTCAVGPCFRVSALGCVMRGLSLLINQPFGCALLFASVSFGLIAENLNRYIIFAWRLLPFIDRLGCARCSLRAPS